MQIAGWRRRVPELRVQDYTLWDEIPGRKRKKERRSAKVRGEWGGTGWILTVPECSQY